MASHLSFDHAGMIAHVQHATLRLWVRKEGTQEGPAIYATDGAWTETGLKWNTGPAPRRDLHGYRTRASQSDN